jgi:hypothetical protein
MTPRLASRQQHRQNIPAQDCSDYYRLNITIPLLDHLITELSARFDAVSSQHIIEFMRLLPSTNTSSATESDENSLQHVLQLYEDDLPSPATFNAELDLWKQKWNSDSQKATELNTAEKALEFADIDFYPNIRALLQVMATLPVTSCECERSISMLRLVKSPLRSSMGQDRLNGLAMLYYHRLVDITPEEVVEEFALSHPRRMLLVNPFQ